MSSKLLRAGFFVLAAAVVGTTVWASGGSSSPSAAPQQQINPEEVARQHYNQGLYYRDTAHKAETKLAAAATDKERQKLEKKISKNYGRAIAEFEDALSNNAQMYQAAGSLGYALRKTGRYRDALEAYDHALSIEPGYAEAIEYRAEAYLGLNRLDEAKQAYIQLFGDDRARADELLDAMQQWIASRRTEPGEVDPATLDAFSGWVDERTEIAGSTAPVSKLRDRDW